MTEPDDRNPTPTLDQVAAVRLAASVEVWPDWPDDPDPDLVRRAITMARASVRDYLRPIRDALADDPRAELVDDDADEVVRSDYDAGVLAVEGSAHLEVTPAEWLAIADGWCLDLAWVTDDQGRGYRTDDLAAIPAVPDSVVPTLGIMVDGYVIPAVSIPDTDEGWGAGGYEPAMIASLYVALAMREPAEVTP